MGMVVPAYFHYIFLGIAIILGLFIIYRPPATTGFLGFVERHFGDVLGLYILHLGIILVIVGNFFPSETAGLLRIGESLIMASMLALKLKTVPGASNGNGNYPSDKVVTQTETTRVTVGSPPAAVAPAVGSGL